MARSVRFIGTEFGNCQRCGAARMLVAFDSGPRLCVECADERGRREERAGSRSALSWLAVSLAIVLPTMFLHAAAGDDHGAHEHGMCDATHQVGC